MQESLFIDIITYNLRDENLFFPPIQVVKQAESAEKRKGPCEYAHGCMRQSLDYKKRMSTFSMCRGALESSQGENYM